MKDTAAHPTGERALLSCTFTEQASWVRNMDEPDRASGHALWSWEVQRGPVIAAFLFEASGSLNF